MLSIRNWQLTVRDRKDLGPQEGAPCTPSEADQPMAAGPGVGTAPEVYWNSHSVLGRDAEVHLLANKLLEERVVVVAGTGSGLLTLTCSCSLLGADLVWQSRLDWAWKAVGCWSDSAQAGSQQLHQRRRTHGLRGSVPAWGILCSPEHLNDPAVSPAA